MCGRGRRGTQVCGFERHVCPTAHQGIVRCSGAHSPASNDSIHIQSPSDHEVNVHYMPHGHLQHLTLDVLHVPASLESPLPNSTGPWIKSACSAPSPGALEMGCPTQCHGRLYGAQTLRALLASVHPLWHVPVVVARHTVPPGASSCSRHQASPAPHPPSAGSPATRRGCAPPSSSPPTTTATSWAARCPGAGSAPACPSRSAGCSRSCGSSSSPRCCSASALRAPTPIGSSSPSSFSSGSPTASSPP